MRWAAGCCLKIPADLHMPSLPVCPWKVTKGENVVLLWWSSTVHWNKWCEDISGRSACLCVRRTKHHSCRITVFYLGVKMLNASCFRHSVSYIQVETWMFYRMSSENTMNVSCELSGKLWHVFVLLIYFKKVMLWCGDCASYAIVSQQTWLTS